MKKNKNFKELMNYAGNHKYLTYLSLFLAAVSGILALLPFVYIWYIIKEVLEVMPNFHLATNIVHNGWLAVFFAIFSMIIYFAGLMCSHKSAFRVAANIRMTLMHHITTLPIGKINEFGSGKLRKIVTESSAGTETYLAHQLPDMAVAIITPLCMIIILFIFDWRLGFVSLIPTILGFIAMSKMAGPAMANDMKIYQNALEDMNNEAVEYVRGIPVVKTFGQSIYTFKKFKSSIDNYDKFCISYTIKCRKTMLIYQTCINSVFAFLISLALIIAKGGIVSDTFLLNLIFYIIFTPIIATTLTKVMFMSENTMLVNDAIERIHSILEISPLPENMNNDKMLDNSIEFKQVQFKYDQSNKKAIDNISFKIPANGMAALVGPSGGGKTTIANLITRFYDVTNGEILIGGVNIKNIKKQELMKTVSYVFQDSKLFKMSVYDNVKIAKPNATKEEVKRALHLAQCDDIIEKLPNGMDTMIGSKGVYFSGGEVERLAIARIILKDAKIVLLDEATAFADPENEEKVQRAFEELAKNKTVIMIAHRLTTIKNANQIFVLNDGKIAEKGSHEELLKKKGIYFKMWNDYQTSISWKVGDDSD